MKNTYTSWSQRGERKLQSFRAAIVWSGVLAAMVIFCGSACSSAPSSRGAGPVLAVPATERPVQASSLGEPPPPGRKIDNSSVHVAAESSGEPQEWVEAFQRKVLQIAAEQGSPTAVVALSVTNRKLLASASHGDISVAQTALPPGSTVKPLLYAAALEQRVLRPDESFSCSGKLPGEGAYACYATHGDLTLPTALATSCNVFGWFVVDRLGWPRVRHAFAELGFGAATGLAPGEAEGFLPPLEVENAQETSRLVGLGHGAIRVTPLQLAAAYGKWVSEQDWQSDKLASVREGMRLVVESERGTGRAAAVQGLAVLGKTGTAEDPEHSGADNGFFVGIAPADEPRLIVVAVVRGAGSGGKTAAPVAARVFSEYQTLESDASRKAGAP